MIYKLDYDYTVVEIGDDVDVEGVYVKVISIIKVNFQSKTVWFTGVPVRSLD